MNYAHRMDNEPPRVRTCRYCQGTGKIVTTTVHRAGLAEVTHEHTEFCDCAKGKAAEYENLIRQGYSVESACAVVDSDRLPMQTEPGLYW